MLLSYLHYGENSYNEPAFLPGVIKAIHKRGYSRINKAEHTRQGCNTHICLESREWGN